MSPVKISKSCLFLLSSTFCSLIPLSLAHPPLLQVHRCAARCVGKRTVPEWSFHWLQPVHQGSCSTSWHPYTYSFSMCVSLIPSLFLLVISLATCAMLPRLCSVPTFQFPIFMMFLGFTSGLFSSVASCWTGHSVPLIKWIFSAFGFCGNKALSPTPNLGDQGITLSLVFILRPVQHGWPYHESMVDSSRHNSVGHWDKQTTPPRYGGGPSGVETLYPFPL